MRFWHNNAPESWSQTLRLINLVKSRNQQDSTRKRSHWMGLPVDGVKSCHTVCFGIPTCQNQICEIENSLSQMSVKISVGMSVRMSFKISIGISVGRSVEMNVEINVEMNVEMNVKMNVEINVKVNIRR